MTLGIGIGRRIFGRDLDERAWAIVLLVMVTILAGVALRLSGFVGGAYSWFFLSGAGDDSWMPMRLAYERALGLHPGSLRDLILVDHVKFQYPPSSLLLYSGFDLIGITPTDVVMNRLVWLSILATPPLVFGLCLTYMTNKRSTLRFSRSDEYLIASAFAVATLFFYPIMISWRLGQIQGFLNLLFAAACFCWLSERKTLAGVMIGATCLIKPQFSLFLIWALLRRQNKFAIGQAASLGAGLLISLFLYGWKPIPDYLEVLSFISRHGEIFWDNTSINGLVNRFYHPNETLIFNYHGWVPYEPTVYIATLVSSIVIVAFALFAVGRSSGRGSALDFMTAGFCFTLAAPIAWGHHFGIAMPIFAILLIAICEQPEQRRGRLFIAASICFLAFSDDWNVTDLLGGTSFTVFQSWRLFAAIALLSLLHRTTADSTSSVVRAEIAGGARVTGAARNALAADTSQRQSA